MPTTRSGTRGAGAAPVYPGLEIHRGLAPPRAPRAPAGPAAPTPAAAAPPAGQATTTTTTTAPAAPAARAKGRKAARGRGKGRKTKARKSPSPSTSPPASPPASPPPVVPAITFQSPTPPPNANAVTAGPAPVGSSAQTTTTTTTTAATAATAAAAAVAAPPPARPAVVPRDPDTGLPICVGCAFMQSCIDHRAADLRSVETQLAIYKRTSKMFEDVGKAYTKALRKANEVIARLGGTQVTAETEYNVGSGDEEDGDGETAGAEDGAGETA